MNSINEQKICIHAKLQSTKYEQNRLNIKKQGNGNKVQLMYLFCH